MLDHLVHPQTACAWSDWKQYFISVLSRNGIPCDRTFAGKAGVSVRPSPFVSRRSGLTFCGIHA